MHRVSLHCGFSCPNRDGTVGTGGCAFCNLESLQPVGFRAGEPVKEQLRRGMAYIRRRHRAERFIAYYQDGSSTYGPAATLAELYAPAVAAPEVVAVAVSTRPDCLGPEALEVLAAAARAKDVWVELGLQTADDTILAAVKRGHTVGSFRSAVTACHDLGLPVCAHVIIGLPGTDEDTDLRTAALLAELGVWGIKLHAFHVLAGTEMARRHAAGEVTPLTLKEHVERVVRFVELLPPATVIHRVSASSPGRLTVAPAWTRNPAAALNAVVAGFEARATWQGRTLTEPSAR